ncbi:MAG: diphosphomevalonate decarboxylase [Bacteroidetes bacterium]|nr:diphosphomevalonate decarboxylase [Bacteroidota bacterium]
MLTQKDFITKPSTHKVDSAAFCWSAPSNIALVKYWGKLENHTDAEGLFMSQIPANPSLSFTLSNCKTTTSVVFERKNPDENFSFDLLFEGQPKEEFKPKIQKFFERVEIYCPYLKDFHLSIDTQNTFPHSSGIASSASGMAALAMNIMSLERALHPEMSLEYFEQKASFLARLGSGSACRSIRGNAVVWGQHNEIKNSSDLFGVAFSETIHPNFKNYQDTILLVDRGEKKVSSTAGHDLMHQHPFAHERFAQAHRNLSQLKSVLQNGDLDTFITLMENEALTLHAMMMTSVPYFILMHPNTLEVINHIWNFRNQTKIPVGFTLDAGANVHILYPENVREEVLQFIQNELVGYCQNGQYICDVVGDGSQQINP